MDTSNYANIIALARDKSDRDKVDMILNESNPKSFKSVPDPYYGGPNGFQDVHKMLDDACNKIMENLEKI
jgi:protein-tyrosine phosphatase